MLGFFINDLEPAWGHLHEGRIFFRLGWLALPDSVAEGKKYLEKALEEARKFWEEESTSQKNIDVEKNVAESSSYVARCIVEIIEDKKLRSDVDKHRFFEELLSRAFDHAIFLREVEAVLVEKAIRKILLPAAIEELKILEMKNQLDQVASTWFPVAIVSLAGGLLEAILLGVVYFDRGVKKINQRDILKVELGSLLKEAISSSVFPSDSVKVSCELVHIFRNRLHPGNEFRSKYKLTPRVAMTLKILLDRSIVHWGNATP